MRMKTILVSVRYPVNKNGKKTLKYAYFLAKLINAKLKIVHVIPKEFTIDPEIIKKNTTKKIKPLMPDGTPVIIYFSNLITGLKRAVKENRADLLIMGAHKRNLLDNILEDVIDMDVTARIVRRIQCPVLIVK